jgi:MFS family permease
VSSVSAIANTIALVPFALAADRYGRKRFVFWGFLSATLAHVLFAYTRDLNLLLLASAMGGVGLAGGFSAAVWTPAWTALLAEKAAPEKRTTAFAWGQCIWTVALTAGSGMSILPTFLQSTFKTPFLASFQYTFLLFAGLAVLSGLVLLPVSETKKIPANSERKAARRFLPEKSLGQISRFSLTLGLVGLASGISIQLLSLWFKKMFGVNEAVLGPWFAAAEITSLIVVPIIPRLTRALGSSTSVVTTQGLSAVLLGSMILAPTYQLAGVIFIIRNFFMNISWPVQQSYLMGTVTVEERASASAITSTIWGVGSSVGPIFAGYLLSGTNYISTSAPLLIGAGIYLISALAFHLLFHKTPPPEEAKTRFSTEIA